MDDMVVYIGRGMAEEAAQTLEEFIWNGTNTDEITQYFSTQNIDVEIWRLNGKYPIWGTYDGSYEPEFYIDVTRQFNRIKNFVVIDHNYLSTMNYYVYRVYVNTEFPVKDKSWLIYEDVSFLFQMRYKFIIIALVSGIVAILCIIFLVSSAWCGGWKRGPRAEKGWWPELNILAMAFGAWSVVYLNKRLEDWTQSASLLPVNLLKGGIIALAVVWMTVWLCGLIFKIKRDHWWNRTLIAMCLFRGVGRLKKMAHKCIVLLRTVPLARTALFVALGVSLLEFIFCLVFVQIYGIILWSLEKLIIVPLVVYVAACWEKFLYAGKALAEGQLDYTIDTAHMIGLMYEHGENLNSIGQGIAKAVEERTKSEHLKTELITNVSHDLKTPLTSIINYSRLISEMQTDNEQVTEYSQVLLRQSERLKKLLEDLVEASKATTGNLEVHLVPCEVGVLLSQAVGEYQSRLEERGLELRTGQLEEPLWILADGRHLWRVFDNLMNNICKYAQEGSRVYLHVEKHGKQVQIIFRNMSKYALDISAEELEERFVRGDKSRHMEGNGLGLPIAKSLVELQNGQMEIMIDGDLFKVILSFEQLDGKSSADRL